MKTKGKKPLIHSEYKKATKNYLRSIDSASFEFHYWEQWKGKKEKEKYFVLGKKEQKKQLKLERKMRPLRYAMMVIAIERGRERKSALKDAIVEDKEIINGQHVKERKWDEWRNVKRRKKAPQMIKSNNVQHY